MEKNHQTFGSKIIKCQNSQSQNEIQGICLCFCLPINLKSVDKTKKNDLKKQRNSMISTQ